MVTEANAKLVSEWTIPKMIEDVQNSKNEAKKLWRQQSKQLEAITIMNDRASFVSQSTF